MFSKEMTVIIDNVLDKEKIDVVIADHLETAQYIPEAYYVKTILHDHNAELLPVTLRVAGGVG